MFKLLALPFFSRPLWNLIAIALIAAVIAFIFHQRRRRREMEEWEREESFGTARDKNEKDPGSE